MFCLPGGMGQVRTESGYQVRCTLSVVRHPAADESLKAVLDLRERDRQCAYPRGLGHHTPGCEFEVETPPDHY